MPTFKISLLVNTLLGIYLLYRVISPKAIEWYTKRKIERERIRKQALTKTIRKEVRAFLEELQK